MQRRISFGVWSKKKRLLEYFGKQSKCTTRFVNLRENVSCETSMIGQIVDFVNLTPKKIQEDVVKLTDQHIEACFKTESLKEFA